MRVGVKVPEARTERTTTAYCVDIDPHALCMYEWLSKPLGHTVCTHHAMWINHTEIRCKGLLWMRGSRVAEQGGGDKELRACRWHGRSCGCGGSVKEGRHT